MAWESEEMMDRLYPYHFMFTRRKEFIVRAGH